MSGVAKPLRRMTDAERATAVANLGYAYFWARRLGRRSGLDRDEVDSACLFALCRAAQEWDADRGPFSVCLKWQCRAAIGQLRLDGLPAGFKRVGRGTPPRTACVPPRSAERLVDARFFRSDADRRPIP